MTPLCASITIVTAMLLAGCQPGRGTEPPPAAPAPPQTNRDVPTVVLPDGTPIAVEIAADEAMRQQGLMYRESVPEGRGMLFLFPATDIYPFWMKNTMIPLDIIWIDETLAIVDVAEHVPPCRADPCPSYAPRAAARYVLELRAGAAREHGVAAGKGVKFHAVQALEVR
ncbi:MAG TPA: DUF192 domain-containing protein [Thermoanaerobaculia bacterium]|nr:DUF192 domain-containing protein [Thermoanaerobaculia bacterium]